MEKSRRGLALIDRIRARLQRELIAGRIAEVLEGLVLLVEIASAVSRSAWKLPALGLPGLLVMQPAELFHRAPSGKAGLGVIGRQQIGVLLHIGCVITTQAA